MTNDVLLYLIYTVDEILRSTCSRNIRYCSHPRTNRLQCCCPAWKLYARSVGGYARQPDIRNETPDTHRTSTSRIF